MRIRALLSRAARLVTLAAPAALAACHASEPLLPANAVEVPIVGAVQSIDVSPLALTPAFSSSISDYYVRCGSGDNPVTVTVTDDSGSASSDYDLAENEALIIGDYWIRCLPHDFPVIAATAHPDAGAPTPGYYLVSSATYAIVLDVNAVPVWYSYASAVCNVDSQVADTISYLPDAEYPYAADTATEMEIRSLDAAATVTFKSPDAPTDEHELRFLANGDYLILADPVDAGVDLSALGSGYGSSAYIADCKVEEVAPSGALVWSWLASDHIDPVQESIEPAVNVIDGRTVVDVYHCNAIDVAANGDLLISSRHTNGVYYVDRATGTIEWKLGGATYNKDGAAHIAVTGDSQGGFNLQHDARFAANGDITLFDDHGADGGASGDVARGLELALDHAAGTATIVWQFPGSEESEYMGSFRRYADGHSVVGWGYLPTDPRIFTEADADGNDVLDVAFTLPTQTNAVSYRAVKVPTTELDLSILRATAGQ